MQYRFQKKVDVSFPKHDLAKDLGGLQLLVPKIFFKLAFDIKQSFFKVTNKSQTKASIKFPLDFNPFSTSWCTISSSKVLLQPT
jgi:hypothetical protein